MPRFEKGDRVRLTASDDGRCGRPDGMIGLEGVVVITDLIGYPPGSHLLDIGEEGQPVYSFILQDEHRNFTAELIEPKESLA